MPRNLILFQTHEGWELKAEGAVQSILFCTEMPALLAVAIGTARRLGVELFVPDREPVDVRSAA
jgi:hypothetical protein